LAGDHRQKSTAAQRGVAAPCNAQQQQAKQQQQAGNIKQQQNSRQQVSKQEFPTLLRRTPLQLPAQH
jgi:hypothetical protein